jgi:hypothetical protein
VINTTVIPTVTTTVKSKYSFTSSYTKCYVVFCFVFNSLI